jgi:hypothetical protein
MLLFDRLKQYAIQEKKYSNNTFAQTIKVFKTFLGWCKSRDYFSGEIPVFFNLKVYQSFNPKVYQFN